MTKTTKPSLLQQKSTYSLPKGLAMVLTLVVVGVTVKLVTRAASSDPTVVAVGDIAWNGPQDGSAATANLVGQIKPDATLTLGDHAYTWNQDFQFQSSLPFPTTGPCAKDVSKYYTTWGKFLSIDYPAIGDHEYTYNNVSGGCDRTHGKFPTDPAKPYWDYFGGRINAADPADHAAGAVGLTSATPDPSTRKGYYSFNMGQWHIIALNSECTRWPKGSNFARGETAAGVLTQMVPGGIQTGTNARDGLPAFNGCAPGSAQYRWLQADLSKPANQKLCTLAYWHKPQFQAGHNFAIPNPTSQAELDTNADISEDNADYVTDPVSGMNVLTDAPNGGKVLKPMDPLVQLLYNAHTDVILNGHSHFYEHLVPLNTNAQPDSVHGMASFVIGTGGATMGLLGGPFPNTIAHSGGFPEDRKDYGVLKMVLHRGSMTYSFVNANPSLRGAVKDSGSINCHN